MNFFSASTAVKEKWESESDGHIDDLAFNRSDRFEALVQLQGDFFTSKTETSFQSTTILDSLQPLIHSITKPILEAQEKSVNESFSFEITLPSMESILVKANITPHSANIALCVSSRKLRSTLQQNEKVIKASLKKSLEKEVNVTIEDDD
jgi:hypothetical protein